jgi:hypothetical protein
LESGFVALINASRQANEALPTFSWHKGLIAGWLAAPLLLLRA